jgi:predicted dehydrogenase
MKDVEIAALCELYDDRLKETRDVVKAKRGNEPDCYKNYTDLLERDDIDAVIIVTPWNLHARIAIAAMKSGKYAAFEAGCASSLQECWDLVRVSEETGMPCMMLENANYDRKDLALLNMVKKQVFGELIHCQCGYINYSAGSILDSFKKRYFRIHEYLHRNRDNYPSHGIGPISKCLNINRGNRYLSLVSVSSKARGLNDAAKKRFDKEHPYTTTAFAQGDIVTTILKCAHGETVLITLDTTLPRPYSRNIKIQGTEGIYLVMESLQE